MSFKIQDNDLIIIDNKHYIKCGDCTLDETYDFDFPKPSICLTSPPYNIGKNGYLDGKRYDNYNDTNDEACYKELLIKSIEQAKKRSSYVFYNIQHLSGNKIALLEVLYHFKQYLVDTLIWHKTTTLPAIEKNVLNSDFEYIYIYKDELLPTRHITSGNVFQGTRSNVINIQRNHGNKFSNMHKALFPIELCNTIITQFTKKGDYVLDVFGGLGTTMLSCQINGRAGVMVENNPLYVEQTIARYLSVFPNSVIELVRGGERTLLLNSCFPMMDDKTMKKVVSNKDKKKLF